MKDDTFTCIISLSLNEIDIIISTFKIRKLSCKAIACLNKNFNLFATLFWRGEVVTLNEIFF